MQFLAISVVILCLLGKAEAFARGQRGNEEEGTKRRDLGKRKHSMMGTSSSTTKSSKSGSSGCKNEFADIILDNVPEAIANLPRSCCGFDGPTAILVTHATKGSGTKSGFDPVWDKFYHEFFEASQISGTCFIMTGYDSEKDTDRTLSEILIDINTVASEISAVPAIMTTDPTSNFMLIEAVRSISERSDGPSIGVFNAGYTNIVVESLVSGKDRLQFIGNSDDRDYGTLAATAALELLESDAAVPLCLNAQSDIPIFALRCSAFYEGITTQSIEPMEGVGCDSSTDPTLLANIIKGSDINALFSHNECCAGAAQAVEIAREATGRNIVIGCMDVDASNGKVDFVTRQPLELQAFQTYSFAILPVNQALQGENGRNEQFFPSLSTLVHITVFNEMIR